MDLGRNLRDSVLTFAAQLSMPIEALRLRNHNSICQRGESRLADGNTLYSRGRVRNSCPMKTRYFFLLMIAAGMLLAPSPGRAADSPVSKSQAPGAEFAQAISTITGVAISPLLGTSAYGAVHYFRTPAEKRANLPWFAQPTFWIPALLLVGLVAAKDIFGTAAPTALKKPFDIAEAVENKVSGLVAAGAFVPFVVTVFGDTATKTATLSSLGFAAADLSWLYNALMVPIGIIAFVIVWFVGNAINVLIILSPFTTVDTALKSARLAILATVPATAYVNPWLGAAWALIIIFICYCLAGWSFRLTHFGTVFIWDYLTLRRKRFAVDPTANKVFLARKLNKAPVRTYGKLVKNEKGRLVLNYRPWLILPRRSVELPEGPYEAGCGAFYSELLLAQGDDTRTIVHLPPRYRGHEAELVKAYELAGTREVGLRAMWTWLKGMFGFRRPLETVA